MHYLFLREPMKLLGIKDSYSSKTIPRNDYDFALIFHWYIIGIFSKEDENLEFGPSEETL